MDVIRFLPTTTRILNEDIKIYPEGSSNTVIVRVQSAEEAKEIFTKQEKYC